MPRYLRYVLLVAITVIVTLIALQWSYSNGRLCVPAFHDDVGYFVDGYDRMMQLRESGLHVFWTKFVRNPPHSPFSSGLAWLSFAVFGVHEWSPYAANGLVVLALLACVDRLMGSQSLWRRLLAFGLVLSTRYAWVSIAEFKPDFAWGIVTAAAMIAMLYRPLTNATWKRLAGIGAAWGLALLIKPSTFPVTAVMLAGALGLALLVEWRRWRRAPLAAGILGLALVLVAGPYFYFGGHSAWQYIQSVIGNKSGAWNVPGDWTVQARYYFDGQDGGGFYMVGWHIWAAAGLAAAGAAAYFIRHRRQGWRMAAMAAAWVIAYALPSIAKVKGLTLGTTSQVMLLLLAVMGLRQLWMAFDARRCLAQGIGFPVVVRGGLIPAAGGTGLHRQVLIGRGVNWLSPVLSAGVIVLIVFTEMPFANWSRGDYHDSIAIVVRNNYGYGIFNTIADRTGHDRTVVVLTTGGMINSPAVYRFMADERGLPYEFDDLDSFPDFASCVSLLHFANFVVASEGGNLDDQSSMLPTQRADQLLNWLRASGEFDEIAAFPSINHRFYFVFANRKSGFGGCDFAGGLTEAFPMQPNNRVPVSRLGMTKRTILKVFCQEPSTRILKISAQCATPNQGFHILLDDGQVGEHFQWPAKADFDQVQHLEVPMQLSAGMHTVTIQYDIPNGNGNNWTKENVVYRQLQVTPDQGGETHNDPAIPLHRDGSQGDEK